MSDLTHRIAGAPRPVLALARNTAVPYYPCVRTIAETPIFQRYAAEVWSDAEREEFVSFIAANPHAGAPASFLAKLKKGVEDAY